ncbi:hypothetical protein PR202_gb24248 [Eleusine coracana subsp. coracana]|uniref:Uncharacterized protein n=1 Tax=Eleusine coracana subsp. coracana TaxID=191504 RepID=A0AAV5FL05_ELECO|nr:hypothetical protein PR202_gb24248 [Eleusine coracana subsp. coracana]
MLSPSCITTPATSTERRRKQPTTVDRSAMDHHHRYRHVAIFLAATLYLVVVHEGRCVAAARPLMTRRLHAVEESTSEPAEAVLDVAAAAEAPEGGDVRLGGGGGEAVLNAGKWLPMPMQMPMPMSLTLPAAIGLRFPPVPLFPGASMPPWLPIGGAPPAFAGPGGMPALVPSYVGATRQEQLSLWPSLFNPMQVRPRLPAATTTALGGGGTTGGGQVDRGGPAIASGGKAAEGETMDVPAAGAVQIGEPKWGVFLGNVDRRH